MTTEVPGIPTGHECPAPGCDVMLALDKFACLTHWQTLTPDTRHEVLTSWRNRDHDPDRYFDVRAVALVELGVPAAEVADLNGGHGVPT